MGIKRLKKVFVITGPDNSGKTCCIKELARMFEKEHYEYTDLLHTTYGEFLNQNYLPQDMNDDIFGYFKSSSDSIGISSAGDDESLAFEMFKFLWAFQLDVIIIATRESFGDSITNKIKNFDEIFPKSFNLKEKVFATDAHTEVKKVYEIFSKTEDEKLELQKPEAIADLFEEIKSTIRGFSYKK